MRINQGTLTLLGVASLLTTTVVFAHSPVVSSIQAQAESVEIEVVTTNPAAIYVPTWRDQKVLNHIQDYTDARVVAGESEQLEGIMSRMQDMLEQGDEDTALMFDAQTVFILDESVDILFDGIERILLPDPVENDAAYEVPEIDAVSSMDTADAPDESDSPTTTADDGGRFEFLDQYGDSIIGTKGLDPLCTLYFDQIDAIAKEQDFPTSVIIATRYREHSCFFKNPDNGRGNYQITSHYYPPGPITRDQFDTQIVNFIEFSRAKRVRYDAIQVFDDIPVTLAYDQLDLTSIRKQAILYNGVHQGVTLENNVYANQNFEGYLLSRQGRDGIVQTVLKVLAWEQENR